MKIMKLGILRRINADIKSIQKILKIRLIKTLPKIGTRKRKKEKRKMRLGMKRKKTETMM